MSEETSTEEQPAGAETDTTDWKAEARKWEERAKKDAEKAKTASNAVKELEQLKASSMTEQEKLVEQARTEARSVALAEVGGRLVDASVRVAAAGRIPDETVGVLLQGLDRSKFLDDNGEVDEKSIAVFVDGIAPKQTEPEPQGFPDLGQGARSGNQMPLNGDPLEKSLRNALGIR